MSNGRVILTVTSSPLRGAKHIFDEPRMCLIGRAPDCDIQLSLPNDPRFANISRHHCEIDIDPPAVRVRDLGSRNGTWLNGERIHPAAAYLEDESQRLPGDFLPLKDGDELGIGCLTLRVRVARANEVRAASREVVHQS
jgi:serine/threonine-protein kinase